MKTIIFSLFFIQAALLTASSPERIEALSAKVILQDGSGYYALSDGSQWKVIGFSKRWRTFSEWWNNVEIAPEYYDCLPTDWYLGAQIETYTKYGNLNVNEADAANSDILRQCTHLLVNRATGQVLFALLLHPADCLVQLYNDAYKDGHTKGFEKGRSLSNQKTDEIYNNGHSEGYKAGYADGYYDGQLSSR